MDAEHAVTGVGVVDDVEGAVTGGDDRSVVDDVGAGDADEGAIAGAGDGAGLEPREREAVRSRLGDAGRAEVRCALEVDHRLPERVLGRGRRLERHRLHGLRIVDTDVGELGCVVHTQVVR